ncbi:MAG: MBL fold metallo-hydrolase [Bdellovibrionales bacterium]|nr:MBL fold metallo-hydrolase [Bdellovibrionales bacterium]
MLERKVVVGPFQCNCRILVCPNTGHAMVLDPGDESQKILREIEKAEADLKKKIQVKYLMHTHGHLDHIAATKDLKAKLGAEAVIAIHGDDEPLYQQLKMQAGLFGLPYGDPDPIEKRIEHEERITLGDLKLDVVHTPGHSPGSVCLRLHQDSATGASEKLYTGDTLFYLSVGRTDLWGADGDLMFKMIRSRILTLDGDTKVCPGHGPDSTIGTEKKQNPFLS